MRGGYGDITLVWTGLVLDRCLGHAPTPVHHILWFNVVWRYYVCVIQQSTVVYDVVPVKWKSGC